MISIRDAQMQALGNAAPGQQLVLPCQATQTWIEIRLVNSQGQPVPGERYELRLPDSSLMSGYLDDEGKARYDPIIAGMCQVSFPGLDAKEWWPA